MMHDMKKLNNKFALHRVNPQGKTEYWDPYYNFWRKCPYNNCIIASYLQFVSYEDTWAEPTWECE